jgi:hypothetical protein
MSTALRIASVTQVLKDLLDNGMIDHDLTGTMGGHVAVTAWPPDRIDVSPNKETSQLNLFMYQATFNQGWRNVALPSNNQQGDRVSNPPLAIDLHYLLTAYGASELHTEILLGYGMQLFHETAVLDRDAIRKAIGPPSLLSVGGLPDSLKLLSSSDLAEQVEQIKLTPEILSIEDISKLWAAFATKYRPTAAYKATVVLIESSKSAKSGLPVKGRNIYVKPFSIPVIDTIMSQSAINQPVLENQKILAGYRLVVSGTQFGNENAVVNIDGIQIDQVLAKVSSTDKQLSFDLPTDLTAGIHELQISNPYSMGTPSVAHKGVISKSSPFIICPSIVGTPAVSQTSGAANAPHSATITLQVQPFINPGQRVAMLINEISVTEPVKSYSFQLPPSALLSPPQPTNEIVFKITGVKKAAYLVRISVDDALSPLDSDAGGNYVTPNFSL